MYIAESIPTDCRTFWPWRALSAAYEFCKQLCWRSSATYVYLHTNEFAFIEQRSNEPLQHYCF